jgi:putative holliday junction resolvase
MRVLCFGVGDKRIGLALSDPAHTLARALEVYTRASVGKDIEELKKIETDYEVGEIVVGLPKGPSGDMGKRAEAVAGCALKIERHTGIRVVMWDERFSSNEAHRIFEMTRVNHRKRKPFIKTTASQIILQGYLDAQKKK